MLGIIQWMRMSSIIYPIRFGVAAKAYTFTSSGLKTILKKLL